jgi:hypothetical protein
MLLFRQQFTGPYYDCSLVQLLLYGLEDQKHYRWTEDEVLKVFPPRLYTQELMDAVPVDEREVYAPPTFKTQQWKNKCGEELRDWDGLVFDRESEVRSQVAERERDR